MPRQALAANATPGDTCPSREAILNAVESLLGQSSIHAEDFEQVAIVDLGTSFSITVKDRVRDYPDASRDCAKRARTAAVFVALTLAPPDIGGPNDGSTAAAPQAEQARVDPSPTPSAPVPFVPTKPSVSGASSDPSFTGRMFTGFELGLKVALPTNSLAASSQWGAQSRFIIGGPRWDLSAGLDIPARNTFEVHALRIQQARYSADWALRRNWDVSPVRASLDVGPLVTLLQYKLLDQPAASRVTRWQLGLRLGVVVAWLGRFVTPFVGADMHVLPSRVPIIVQPEGVIGRSTAIWLGATLGVAWGGY